jgi:hypothetical protein
MYSLPKKFSKWPAVVLLSAALLWPTLLPTCVAGFARPKSLTVRQRRAKVALARLSQAKATAGNEGVLIQWRTSFEIDNLGFNIYRERGGQRRQINPGIIAGSALIVGQGTPLQEGFSYSWLDRAGTLDCKYYLEDVDLSGQSTLHPVVTPEWSATLPKSSQSQLLSNLGTNTSGFTGQTGWAEASDNSSSKSAANALSTATIADQWAIANQPALKIGVNANGWYRVTQTEMAAAGFDTSGDARNLRMFVGAIEIAIRVSRDSGALTAADYIEFWGQRLDLPSTDTQIYWLLNGDQAGKRIVPVGDFHTEARPTPQPAAAVAPSPAVNNFSSWFPGFAGATSSGDRPGDNKTPTSRSPTIESNGNYQPSIDTLPPVLSSLSERNDSSISSPTVTADINKRTSTQLSAGNVAAPERALSNGAKKVRRSLEKRSGGDRAFRNGQFKRNRSRSRRRKHRQNHLRSARHNHASFATVAAPAFVYTVERKDRIIYYPGALNGDAENFFGNTVTPTSGPFTMTIHNPEPTSPIAAQLQVSLRGVSAQSHQVNVFVNGNLMGTIGFSLVDPVTQTFFFPVSTLLEGANTIKLVGTIGSNDVSLIDYVRLIYPHSFKSDNDSLEFSIKSNQSARLDGFTIPNIRLLDLSDLTAVEEIRPIVQSSGAGYVIEIPAGGQGKARRMIALPDTQLSHPVSLSLNQASTLNHNTNAADLLIISYKDFIPSLAPLVAQRQSQGFNVMVANVEDIYDEFSYGLHAPQAIKDFLSLTRTTWSHAPAYLLLVGDASYDARNYMNRGMWDLVPSKPVDTFYMEAASDDSLADFDNDGVPEMSVGRLPARSVAEANLMVSKIVNFNPASIPQSALMVADNPVDYNFENFTEQLIPLLPSTVAVQRVYRAQEPSDTATHNDIINNFNSGQVVVNYSGHGNIDIWGGSIFTSTDALALTNGSHLPFVVVMDCLNGFFTDPALEGLAESLLKAPNGGAVASFASSGLTIADPQHAMGQRMFQLLYSGPSIPIGDASRQSKTATNDLDVRRTWILFGDPTMKIR